VQNINGQEELCGDFSYQVKISSLERLSVEEIKTLVGAGITVKISFKDSNEMAGNRFINGIIYKLKEMGVYKAPLHPEIWQYEIEIGSWLRQLATAKDCRVFQKGGNNTKTILSDLFEELGFRDFKFKLRNKLPRREYAVIYNETLANFAKRLCFEDHILWYFDHSEKWHTLVFTDDSFALPELSASSMGGQYDAIQQFCRESSFLPVKEHLVSSYFWENPPVKNILKSIRNKNSRLKSYDYSNSFSSRQEGEDKSDKNMMAIEAHQTRYSGESTLRGFVAGFRFTLNASRLPELNGKKFIITNLKINAKEESYKNTFMVAPSSKQFFRLRDETIYKPVITGFQTAMVVGDAGTGKVVTDKLGRVKIHFHWNHRHQQDALKTAAFVRVASPYSGGLRGFIFTPRVGEEVTVVYENGDPEKPIITGSVYSNERTPPTTANSKPYVSTIKSSSDSDSNEICFDDSPGSQSLDLQAKKDLNVTVGGNLTVKVKDNIYVQAKKVNIIVRKNIKVRAGGNIVNLTLSSINNTAGRSISNMALGGVVDIAGGLINNMAGCSVTNTAILAVDNEAGAGIKGNADTLLANTALRAVGNTGKKVENDAKLAMTNISNGGIINDAQKVQTETLFQIQKVKETSTNETKSFNIKGLLSKIN